MNNEEFAVRVEGIRGKLYKTALVYLGNEALALDAVDEAVYKALCSHRKLRQPEYFFCQGGLCLLSDSDFERAS